MTETVIIKCQSCIERQLKEPEDAVGLYKNLPICDKCLGAIMSNMENVQADSISITSDKDSIESRRALALQMLDSFESVFDNFPLTAEEVLTARDDFYNHRAPALINCTTEQIKTIINRRKAVLYAIRIKDEQWSTIIEQLRNEARREAGLVGVAKSIKEKVKQPSGYSDDKAKKLAKMMGISVAQLNAMGADARATEFKGIVGAKTVEEADTRTKFQHDKTTRSSLERIQENLKSTPQGKINPVTGRPYK